MRFLKRLVLSIILLVVIVAVIGMFLPQQIHVERTISVDATAEQVFPYLNESRRFNEWSPWAKIDENTQYTFTGPESGVGAGMVWKSEHPNVGSGNWEIIESVENELIKTHLDFGTQGDAVAFYQLKPKGDTTSVTWGFDTDMGKNPVSRWFGLMMDRWIGGDYEKGLTNLKNIIEQ